MTTERFDHRYASIPGSGDTLHDIRVPESHLESLRRDAVVLEFFADSIDSALDGVPSMSTPSDTVRVEAIVSTIRELVTGLRAVALSIEGDLL
jgi:hypothetical protein